MLICLPSALVSFMYSNICLAKSNMFKTSSAKGRLITAPAGSVIIKRRPLLKIQLRQTARVPVKQFDFLCSNSQTASRDLVLTCILADTFDVTSPFNMQISRHKWLGQKIPAAFLAFCLKEIINCTAFAEQTRRSKGLGIAPTQCFS